VSPEVEIKKSVSHLTALRAFPARYFAVKKEGKVNIYLVSWALTWDRCWWKKIERGSKLSLDDFE
jgi:hypothetical protein